MSVKIPSQSLRFSWLIAATVLAALISASIFAPQVTAQATETILYEFTGPGSAGQDPQGPLVMDGAGNLYGEDPFGGQYFNGDIFKLTPVVGGMWQRTDLYSFLGNRDGGYPSGGLTIDGAGNLYGSTSFGGSASCTTFGGCGVVFELSPNSGGQWVYTVLHVFTGGEDGYGPYGLSAPLALDKLGNLYGTSLDGGDPTCVDQCGLVFKLTRSLGWAKSTIRAFSGQGDGAHPVGSLAFDSAGNLYGATNSGGSLSGDCVSLGCGVVFELSPTVSGGWKETVLHSFRFSDGSGPLAGVSIDTSGNLYGTTLGGGTPGACANYNTNGCGVVFEVSPGLSGWKESVIHAFTGGPDGGSPEAGMTVDLSGNLYGATPVGGVDCNGEGCGVVFELIRHTASWQKKVLYAFHGKDGGGPLTNLVLDGAGNLYAASTLGGVVVQNICKYGCGLIFELTPFN